ncbi:MAG: polymerase beta domain protein region [Rhizobium sp.]|nr:polymerase beta domain protein region [Rhizobium sp.]
MIIPMLNETLKTKLEHVRSALTAAGVSHLAVFGSQARGQASPESDLDILIDIKSATAFSLIDLIGIEQMLTEATGLKVNAVMRRSPNEQFNREIRQDIVEIF